MMWIWRGAHEITPPRALASAVGAWPGVALNAWPVLIIELAQDAPDPARVATLEALLQSAGPLSLPDLTPDPAGVILVLPRAGTRSPWSSRATEIVHRCGLADVARRVERGVVYRVEDPQGHLGSPRSPAWAALQAAAYDRMTEQLSHDLERDAWALLARHPPSPLERVALDALAQANVRLGLALSPQELDYLASSYQARGAQPTDVELMMFAQANSEHCRHKIFKASWVIDGQPQPRSLMEMIQHTHERHPQYTLSAYSDNAAVFEGLGLTRRLLIDPESGLYTRLEEPSAMLLKVETHNHPTAISPHPGAATGAGGELRDEGACGTGAQPKMGLVGFATSHLRLPSLPRPWERPAPAHPDRLASPLQIMIEAPLGAASFQNEFGRPTLAGYFRTYEQLTELAQGSTLWRGYHKPIMLAGGVGQVRPMHTHKRPIPSGAAVVVLGGPAMTIGLGGGAASSVSAGQRDLALDFASVQRANPELQRRCQEVIERCCALGAQTPILSIHDVGAGGLSNAVPELLHDAGLGGELDLRAIPTDEPGMSPLALWCNEAQERYVLALDPARLPQLEAIAARERCPLAVLGYARQEDRLHVRDEVLEQTPIDVPMSLLFGQTPRLHLEDERASAALRAPERPWDVERLPLSEAALRVLRHPSVASKGFLITIADRSVGGLVARDQLVGPWQVPVSDVAVTLADHGASHGEAMALGERSPVAVLDAAASARLAVAEALLNLAAARVPSLSRVKLSANWMASAQTPGQGAALYDAVHALGMELCPQLGVSIPVGKDSMSMRAAWDDHQVVSPMSVVITACSPVSDAAATLTPQLTVRRGLATTLLLLELGQGPRRLGGSILAQCYDRVGGLEPPDLDRPEWLRGSFQAIQELASQGMLLAYHDRSDGGLLATLCEMAFASRCGMVVGLASLGVEHTAALFDEAPGAVLQVRDEDVEHVRQVFARHGVPGSQLIPIASPMPAPVILMMRGSQTLLALDVLQAQQAWSEVSHAISRLRDDPACADEELALLTERDDLGLTAQVPEALLKPLHWPALILGARPRVAVLREQGVNGHLEMAHAFMLAGFQVLDLHMSDLIEAGHVLDGLHGLAIAGGFSYGDVLGAGRGWAGSILHHDAARQRFEAFFAREDAFTLGVCNGCQMLSHLAPLIPGASSWPRFLANRSGRFEARLSMVRVEPQTDSVLLSALRGCWMPVAVAHGEGRAHYDHAPPHDSPPSHVALRYVDGLGQPTSRYPHNPNGSQAAVAAVTAAQGRVTAMMPHPERVVRGAQLSWRPEAWGDRSPWLRLFEQAYAWVESFHT